jgi:hypothetical protein
MFARIFVGGGSAFGALLLPEVICVPRGMLSHKI